MTKNEQKHGFPALASFFIVGLGQAVKGHWAKAALYFFGFWLCFGLIWVLLATIPLLSLVAMLGCPAIWIINVWDAYNSNDSKV